MCDRKAYCVGDMYHDNTAEWLSPHVKSFKGDKYRAEQIVLNNGACAKRGDYILLDGDEASVIPFEDAMAYFDQCRCATCEYAVRNLHPNMQKWDRPICLVGGHPQSGWQSICCILLDGPDNQYDHAYKPRTTELSHVLDMAEWDADYYAKEVLGFSDEDIDANETDLHAIVCKDLLEKHRTSLMRNEHALLDLAKTAVTRFSELGRAMHASNIDSEIEQMQASLASMLGAHKEE